MECLRTFGLFFYKVIFLLTLNGKIREFCWLKWCWKPFRRDCWWSWAACVFSGDITCEGVGVSFKALIYSEIAILHSTEDSLPHSWIISFIKSLLISLLKSLLLWSWSLGVLKDEPKMEFLIVAPPPWALARAAFSCIYISVAMLMVLDLPRFACFVRLTLSLILSANDLMYCFFKWARLISLVSVP